MNNTNKGFDYSLLGVISLLFLFGLLLIASAIHVADGGSPKRLFVQTFSFLIGVAMTFMLRAINYEDLKKYSRLIYVFSILSMLLVYVPGLGAERGGARGWIDLKIIDFQPIEIAKLGFIIVFAQYLEKNAGKLNSFAALFKASLIPLPIVALLLAQPDFGGAMVFFCIILGMIFVAGADLKLLAKITAVALLMLPIAYKYAFPFVLRPYQMQRLTSFFSSSSSTTDGGYQVFRSLVAIASGGFLGKGPFGGSQNNLGFLSVSDSDFIFAVCGEEYGVVGMFLLIGLYFLLLYKILDIAMTAKDLYGSLIVVGVLSIFMYQFMQNIGMTLGIMPVTGLPLPFVSYGGSSMLMSMLSIALVQNVATRRRRINF